MTEIVTRTPAQELVAQIRSEEFQGQVALALPPNVSPARFARVAITAINQNPDLGAPDVDRGSIFTSLLRAAADGLLPDGREAALVLFKNRDRGGRDAVYMPMVGGFRKIAADHSWSLRGRVVFEHDEFAFEEGVDQVLRHIPARPGVERGKMIAAYAVATCSDGRRETRVMYAPEIEKRRQVSRQPDGELWRKWPEQAWEKTVVRDLFQDLPLGDLDVRVVRVIEASETDPAEATTALYDRHGHTDTPAPVAAVAAPTEAPDPQAPADGGSQQAESPDPQPAEAASPPGGSAPDYDDEPDTGAVEESTFKAPEGAVSDDAQAANLAADAAARAVIVNGKHQGKTIGQVASEARGEGWLKWACKTPDHPNSADARTYARVYLPELFQAAMAELQTAAQ